MGQLKDAPTMSTSLVTRQTTGTTVDSPMLAPMHELQAQLASVSGGLATDDYLRAWSQWWLALASHPTSQWMMVQEGVERAIDSWNFALQALAGKPLAHEHTDAHFKAEAWNQWPYNALVRSYGNLEQWSEQLLGCATGLSAADAQRLEFMRRQLLELLSPAHSLATNPELLEQTRAESGANLLRGWQHLLEDAQRKLSGGAVPGTEDFRVGEQLATTPGKVVMRNELIELIQYTPQSGSVYAEPILITPAWIMKYYILDLSPRNSLVKYLVEQGHTVFMISWRNPTAGDRNLGMDDYLRSGVRAALEAISAIAPAQRVHGVGYCIGGTLLSIAAAALAGEGDTRLASVTLLAAQTDFSEPGELSLFITPSQLRALDALMERDGVLASERMGGAFALLRSGDLIWDPAINTYLRGERAKLNDLMAWNADGTRMPCRMHGEYLKRLYLHNELATGTFTVAEKVVSLQNISVPMFVVGTETDHVAPWPSAYKTRALTRSDDFTFLLTSGGHNAGIVSGPVHPKRRHRIYTWTDATSTLSTSEYQASAELRPGSWWPSWQSWLAAHSSHNKQPPPSMGNSAAGYPPLCDAPGGYVLG
jgi:polyhydroxyalkanoate synthase subunit PhaC